MCTYIGIRLSESDCHLICRTYVHTKAKLEVEMGSVLTRHFGLSNVGIDSSQCSYLIGLKPILVSDWKRSVTRFVWSRRDLNRPSAVTRR